MSKAMEAITFERRMHPSRQAEQPVTADTHEGVFILKEIERLRKHVRPLLRTPESVQALSDLAEAMAAKRFYLIANEELLKALRMKTGKCTMVWAYVR